MRHRGSFWLVWLACVALLAGMPACNHAVSFPVEYRGTIERIEDVAGDHYTTARDRTALTRVQLHSTVYGVFSILIPGIYSESIYGRVGDSVTFTGPRLPFRGELWLEHLRGYEVHRRT